MISLKLVQTKSKREKKGPKRKFVVNGKRMKLKYCNLAFKLGFG